jgi:hypothetical protein
VLPFATLRRLAAALFIAGTLVLPGAAVAHGVAHEREHLVRHHDSVDVHADEHEHDHRGAHGDPRDEHGGSRGAPSLAEPDHRHVAIDQGFRSRLEELHLALPYAPEVPVAATKTPARRRPVSVALLAHGDPYGGLPPRTRAPPLG